MVALRCHGHGTDLRAIAPRADIEDYEDVSPVSIITEEARQWALRAFPTRRFAVGRSDIIKFAHAAGIQDPVHLDVAAAQQAGYPDLLAPPYFPYVLRMHASNLTSKSNIEADGSASEDVPPLNTRRAMAGETEVCFAELVFAGDPIAVSKQIVDLYEKSGRSGAMVFVKTEFTFRNQHDKLVMRETFTRIYR